MTRRPMDVARFHHDFDRHENDRLRLFAAVATMVEAERVLYPGSYVDIAPSVFFADVAYVDVDDRAARFFTQHDEVEQLIASKRPMVDRPGPSPFTFAFHHLDYTGDLPIAERSVDLLVSLYAGFIGEHCGRYLRPGGHLFVNPSHGDVAMADLDPTYELVAVVRSDDGSYVGTTAALDQYLIPKRGRRPTVDELHDSGRGVGYTRSPFAYLFRKRPE